jgi:hypothetical protein
MEKYMSKHDGCTTSSIEYFDKRWRRSSLTTDPLPLLAEFFHKMPKLGQNEFLHGEADRVF